MRGTSRNVHGFICVCAAWAASVTVAFAQDAGDSRRGRDFAERTCFGCHAVSPGQMQSRLTKAPSFQAIADTPGMTGFALNAFLRSPHKSMPNFVIASRDISDVVAYILTLKSKP